MSTSTNKKMPVRYLTESALLIAMSTVLSLFKPIDLPMGGGITICSMVPMIVLAYRWGLRRGLLASLVYGVLQLLIGVGTNSFGLSLAATFGMLAIDYLLAYTCLGLGGLFRNRFRSPTPALLLGGGVAVVARYLCHFLSGVIFWGSYAAAFFGPEGDGAGMGTFVLGHFSGLGLAIVYSAVVNGILMLGELVLTELGLAIVSRVPVLRKKMC